MTPRVLEETAEEALLSDSLDEEDLVIAAGLTFSASQITASPNLTDGGMVGGVRVSPMADGRRLTMGRPAAIRAWMWNGTESLLTLAWTPDGKAHDSARRYFRKRVCLCCQRAGFQRPNCPDCQKKSCERCRGGQDKKQVIPCFYRRKDDVPFPSRFYGSIDCFLPFCARRGGYGFLTQEDMRMHARTRHRMEYQAHLDTVAAAKADEVDELRKQLNTLMAHQLTNGSQSSPKRRRRSSAEVQAAKAKAAGKTK